MTRFPPPVRSSARDVEPLEDTTPPEAMLETIRRDGHRYAALGGWYRNAGFWVGATYRYGVWARSLRNRFVRLPLLVVHRLAVVPWRLLLNVTIDARRVGPGLCLIHPHNVVIGSDVEIGEDCLIFHEVTLGTRHGTGVPRIGNNVDIYVGARVLGGVTVGDGSRIGANCVVTRDVPANSLVAQMPPRIIARGAGE